MNGLGLKTLKVQPLIFPSFVFFFFFFDVKLITLNQTKSKTVHPGSPAAQYSLVFPQPKHFVLTHFLQLELTCVQSYSLTEPHH